MSPKQRLWLWSRIPSGLGLGLYYPKQPGCSATRSSKALTNAYEQNRLLFAMQSAAPPGAQLLVAGSHLLCD